jgi:PAS domain S-box-containing protein
MFAMNFPPELDRRYGPTTFYDVTLQPASFSQLPQEKPIVDYLVSTVSGQKLDLVVTVGGPAAVFALKCRQQLFPAIPTVLAAVDYRHLQNFVLGANDTAVSVMNKASEIIENIRQVLPETKVIYVVVGNTNLEQFWKNENAIEFQRFEGELQFVWLNDLSYTEMLARCASLPPHSAIFYVGFTVDAKGAYLTEARVLAELHASANAPIFGQHSTQLGRGVVGGPVMSIEDATTRAADVAVRVLRGESPSNIKLPPQQPGPPLYDWRELQHWNIDENRLPPDSIVRFREPTAWQRYKWQIVAGISICLLEGMLILALLANLNRRRRAERDLRESRNRFSAVLDTAVEGILTISTDGLIESVNPAAERIFGYTSADIVGQSVSKLMSAYSSDEPDPSSLDGASQSQLNASGLNGEFIGRRKDSSRFPIELTASEITLDHHHVFTLFVRDVSDRKQAEQIKREFGGRLLQAQETERSRLARELHDDITQRLAQLAIVLDRDLAKRAMENEKLREARDGLTRLSEDVRSLAYKLHPALLEHLGLRAALKAECERFSRQEVISVEISLAEIPTISKDCALSLFRVAQEALNNVRRHAQAKTATVSLRELDGGLLLSVSDTGVGFDSNAGIPRPTLGLYSIEERVRLLGGKLEIRSAPGHGTTLLAWIPLKKAADGDIRASECENVRAGVAIQDKL